MGTYIKKKKIKQHINWLEKELNKCQKKMKQASKLEDYENLQVLYCKEENLNGQIEASKYILENC